MKFLNRYNPTILTLTSCKYKLSSVRLESWSYPCNVVSVMKQDQWVALIHDSMQLSCGQTACVVPLG